MHAGVMIETIRAVKVYLDGELTKYVTWEEMNTADKIISGVFPSAPDRYGQLRVKGVGRETICRFLGGNWKKWRVSLWRH